MIKRLTKKFQPQLPYDSHLLFQPFMVRNYTKTETRVSSPELIFDVFSFKNDKLSI